MNALQKVNEDGNILFNITSVLTQHLKYQQIYTYAHTLLAYLRDCLIYMRQVATHTMDYINAAMTNILSPCADFSFCCTAFNPIKFSATEHASCYRQAFILY